MTRIIVDGESYEGRPEDNLLQTLLSLGFDLPYFCWHPALGSVGACRQCAVVQYRDESDTRGRLAMACMTPVSDGLRIGLQSADAVAFRASIIELLMTNHPHDCPVCEEGGECHLQDMTVMTGHTERRFRGTKRTHRNQYLGPFVNHEMNRCIACYRCVRFYKDYAGGDDLQVFASRNHVYFGRFEDGTLQSPFSGNLVEVCPTGVFTDRTFSQHYTRKWDLQTAPSICVHCSLGCNTAPGERYGTLRRIVNRYHGEVNGYFLCDRGRFGYGFVNGERRIRTASLHGRAIDPAATEEALSNLAQSQPIGIGSPRASLEANLALRRLVGAERFYLGVDDVEFDMLGAIVEIQRNWPVHTPSLRETEQADAILVLGEDVGNTAPRLELALRQAVRTESIEQAARIGIPGWHDAAIRELAQDARSPLFVLAPGATTLDGIAESTLNVPLSDVARLGFALAHRISEAAPAPADPPIGHEAMLDRIATVLAAAHRPLLVCGTGCRSLALIHAAANIAKALAARRGAATAVSFVVPECNSLGLALLGGGRLADAFRLAENGEVRAALILENDLYRRAERESVDRFMARAGHVAVIDHTSSDTTAKAELVVPGASFAETEGTFVSAEGRAQRFFSVLAPIGDVRDSWRWLDARSSQPAGSIDRLTRAAGEVDPLLSAITAAAPDSAFRVDGQRVPRQSHRYSGRTAMLANLTIHEPKPPEDPDSALSYSMEGARTGVPPALRSASWAPHWNSGQQSINKFQDEVGGHLSGGDPGIRLLDGGPRDTSRWFDATPAQVAREGAMPTVPRYHVFGSEECSALAGPLVERVPAPYLSLHPDEAGRLCLGETVVANIAGGDHELPLLLDENLPTGVVGVPAGLPGFPPGPCPNELRLRKPRGATR
ncbi:MAG: NADH-quinone oxidoreductase subunit NuoG [Methylotetracoccus sp.]